MSIAFFQSERLWFRAPELADLEVITRWMNKPEVRRYLDERAFPLSLLAEEQWVRARAEAPQRGAVKSDVVLAFGEHGELEPFGVAGLHDIRWISRRAEFGICVGDPARWGMGFGREISRKILEYAFVELNLERVGLRVHADNERGLRCYQSVGYVREGLLRRESYNRGSYGDTVLMSVLRSEWTPEAQRARRGSGRAKARKKDTKR